MSKKILINPLTNPLIEGDVPLYETPFLYRTEDGEHSGIVDVRWEINEEMGSSKILKDGQVVLQLKVVGELPPIKGSGMEMLDFDEVIIGDLVTTISDACFFINEEVGLEKLKKVYIPDSVTSINQLAFAACGLTSITIPNSVTSIGEGAFLFNKYLTEVNLPNSITKITDNMFSRCSRLTDITIPNSVTSIDDEAFLECTHLTAITIPDSVTSIGHNAFAYCIQLKKITIPDSVTSIDDEAFYNCGLLSSVVYKGVTYTRKADIISALESNGVTLGRRVFDGTALIDTPQPSGDLIGNI